MEPPAATALATRASTSALLSQLRQFSETYAAEAPSENGFDEAAAADIIADDDGFAESSDSFDEIDYGREFQDYLDPGYKTQEIEYKEDAPSFEQFLTHSPNLSEHLEWQLHLMTVEPHVEEAVMQIIGNLDEDGRLTVSLEEVAELGSCSLEDAEESFAARAQPRPRRLRGTRCTRVPDRSAGRERPS